MRLLSALAVALMMMLGTTAVGVEAALLGPSPYSSFSDSPFFPVNGFTYFHLEDFDDHALNTLGVSASAGAPSTASGFNGSIIDQVGLAGGCPPGGPAVACDTFFASGNPGITFTFSKAALGTLPNAVGIVWTDGAGEITFEAFDENGNSLGTVTGNHADGSFFGTIADDRFYGATNAGGISAIHISNTSGGIEVDHLQYGLRGPQNPPTGVPLPGALALLGAGLLATGVARIVRR